MARNVATSVENSFVKGFVTEATGLNFPEQAVTESDNTSFNEHGEAARRKGINTESNFTAQTVDTTERAFNEYLWESVGGDGDVNFHVQQVGRYLYFYRLNPDGNISTGYFAIVDLLPKSLIGTEIDKYLCQFTSGFSYLFVANPHMDPVWIGYDKNTNTVSSNSIQIVTRDTSGWDDGLTPRLPTITDTHFYNLINQGFSESRVYAFKIQTESYPSDFDVWWLYKNSDGIYVPGETAFRVERGNSPAPKGSITMVEFYQDRANLAGIPLGIPVISSGSARPSTIEFFAGRVFYAGVSAPNFANKVYFSQIIEGTSQFGSCYQANDPTSEIASDLLASDGGVIQIPDAGTILRLWTVDAGLMVFASNGIWQITGSSGIGFTANDYTVRKLSSIATISNNSFVDVAGSPMWWAADGIYTVAVNTSIGTTQIQSVSNDTIRTYFDNIPIEAKKYAKGSFNINARKVQWIFRDAEPTTFSEQYSYNKILNYNVISKAFYLYTVDDSVTDIKGITCIRGSGSTVQPELVVTNSGEIVTDNALNQVTVDRSTSSSVNARFKYTITYGDYRTLVTFAEENSPDYLDWQTLTTSGIDYTSYFNSGYRVRGEGQKKFQSNYVVFYSNNEEPSTYYVSCIWDYSTSKTSGRWSVKQKIENFADGYSYKGRRVKMRGNGKALQFRIESLRGKSFHLIGWSTYDSINGNM